jgi:hypothetical protein
MNKRVSTYLSIHPSIHPSNHLSPIYVDIYTASQDIVLKSDKNQEKMTVSFATGNT